MSTLLHDGSVVLAAMSEPGWLGQLVGVILSLCALASYFAGYVLAHRRAAEKTFSLPGYLCLFGIVASLAWLIMPLLPQPRLPNLLDWIRGQAVSPIALAAQLYGIVLAATFLTFTVRSTKSNWTVTYERFFAPERLLTDGLYGVVRHPMLSGDFFAHAGIALVLGGAYTIVLLPIYYLINEAFVEIQERYVLYPKFGDQYRAYARTTSRMLDSRLTLVLAIGVALTAGWLWVAP